MELTEQKRRRTRVVTLRDRERWTAEGRSHNFGFSPKSSLGGAVGFKEKLIRLNGYPKRYHRVDSVIESSLREITGSKKFALINLSLNFCETTIHDNKVLLENLVAVH